MYFYLLSIFEKQQNKTKQNNKKRENTNKMMTTMKELARNLLAMLAVAGTLMLMLPRQKRQRSSGPIWRAKGPRKANDGNVLLALLSSLDIKLWCHHCNANVRVVHRVALYGCCSGPDGTATSAASPGTGAYWRRRHAAAFTAFAKGERLDCHLFFHRKLLYTHYFYVVLKAEYTLPSFDLNGVPIPMFLYTHFYFSLYHTLASMALRSIERAYAPSRLRTLLYWTLTLIMAYVTGAMETITIAGFPCYKFEDFHMAVILGSAMYGIYFIVSYPMYKRIDEEGPGPRRCGWSSWRFALRA